MRTLMIDVCDPETAKAQIFEAVRHPHEVTDGRLSFVSEELLFTVLTARRWTLLKALAGAGPVGVRELARRVDRDVKGVHTDAQALVKAGVIDKLPDGKLHFPYDAVHLELNLKAAA